MIIGNLSYFVDLGENDTDNGGIILFLGTCLKDSRVFKFLFGFSLIHVEKQSLQKEVYSWCCYVLIGLIDYESRIIKNQLYHNY